MITNIELCTKVYFVYLKIFLLDIYMLTLLFYHFTCYFSPNRPDKISIFPKFSSTTVLLLPPDAAEISLLHSRFLLFSLSHQPNILDEYLQIYAHA